MISQLDFFPPGLQCKLNFKTEVANLAHITDFQTYVTLSFQSPVNGKKPKF